MRWEESDLEWEDDEKGVSEADPEEQSAAGEDTTDTRSGDTALDAAIEAVLFAMGNAVELSQLASAIQVSQEKVEERLGIMRKRYEAQDRGIRIMQLENAYQLCTKKEYYDCLIRIAMHPVKPALTDVMLETLSIIAYKQPVTKAEIEKIRGVKSDHAVNRLVEFELVRELGRMDAPGRPILFGTTEVFLRTFGVEAIGELPILDPVRMSDFRAEAEEEIQARETQVTV